MNEKSSYNRSASIIEIPMSQYKHTDELGTYFLIRLLCLELALGPTSLQLDSLFDFLIKTVHVTRNDDVLRGYFGPTLSQWHKEPIYSLLFLSEKVIIDRKVVRYK